jgi:hypothetical protein
MSVKPSIEEIVGKRIKSVVVSEVHAYPPRTQVFLVFDDGTAYEFYGDDLNNASSLDSGGMEAVLGYLSKREEGLTRIYPAQ